MARRKKKRVDKEKRKFLLIVGFVVVMQYAFWTLAGWSPQTIMP
jgi:hypothetical protein